MEGRGELQSGKAAAADQSFLLAQQLGLLAQQLGVVSVLYEQAPAAAAAAPAAKGDKRQIGAGKGIEPSTVLWEPRAPCFHERSGALPGI